MEDQRDNLVAPKATWSDFWRHYSQWKNASILIGTAGSWFFLDVGKWLAKQKFHHLSSMKED
jgi:PHS family inorganic phosphate transporter-like MFS transporter